MAALLVIGSLVVITNRLANPKFKANIIENANGDIPYASKGVSYSYPYVNLTIKFASPGVLDPSKLNLTVSRPGGELAFGSSGMLLSRIRLAYFSYMRPHWLATYGDNTSPGYYASVVNPDGMTVGGTSSSVTAKDSMIESGAIMILAFPMFSNDSSIQGLVLTASYQGESGAVNVTLH